jgi:hypothetical protein
MSCKPDWGPPPPSAPLLPIVTLLVPPGNFSCLVSHQHQLLYVKTAKAASTSVGQALSKLLSDLRYENRCAKYAHRYRVFTTTRNPLERVRDGYAEADRRLTNTKNRDMVSSRMQFLTLPHSDEPRRFTTFLDEIFEGRFDHDLDLMHITQHAALPALVRYLGAGSAVSPTCMTVRALRVEGLSEGWQRYMSEVGLTSTALQRDHAYSVTPREMDEVRQAAKSGRKMSEKQLHVWDAHGFNMTSSAMRRVCELFWLEYAAFQYALPEPCVHKG